MLLFLRFLQALPKAFYNLFLLKGLELQQIILQNKALLIFNGSIFQIFMCNMQPK